MQITDQTSPVFVCSDKRCTPDGNNTIRNIRPALLTQR